MVAKNLHVLITADAKPVESALQRVESGFKRITGLGLGSLTGLVGGGSVLYELNKGFNQILEIKRVADTLGVSIEKVAGLKAAAGGDWEGAQSGIAKMLKHLGEAKLGSEEAAKGFHLLGIETKDVGGLKTEQTLGMVVDKLKAIEDPAMRAYVASQVFGKGWEAMVPLINKGSDGIDRATEATNKFGAVTREMAAEVAQSKRELKELGEEFDSFWRSTAVGANRAYRDLKFFLETLTDTDEEFSRHSADRYQATHPSTGETLSPEEVAKADALKKLVDQVGELEAKLRDEQAALQGAGSEVDSFARKHKGVTDAMLEQAHAIENQNKALKEQEKIRVALDTAAEKIKESGVSDFDKFQNEIANVNNVFESGRLTLDQYTSGLAAIVNQFEKLNQKANEYRGTEALEFGSAAAASTVYRSRFEGELTAAGTGNNIGDLVEFMRQDAKDKKKRDEEIRDELRRINQAKF